MDIAGAEEAIVEDLLALPDVFERMAHLVDSAPTGRAPEADRRAAFLVRGCTAELHVVPSREGDRWLFTPFSEAPMVAALAGLFCRLYSGQTSKEILAHETAMLDRTGLRRQLSPNRQAGAERIVARIKDYVREAADPAAGSPPPSRGGRE